MDEHFLFKPVQTGRAVEEIALQLEAAINSGEIKPGDRLPSERQLQILFKTGRGIIREAMRILRQKDLVEIKKGAKGGAFVKHIEERNLNESLALFLKQHSINPESIIEFRESVDRTIIVLAITRGSKSDREELLQKAREFHKYVSSPESDREKISDMDRELNTLLAKLTKNPVFEWVMNALQLGFSSYDQILYEDFDYRVKTAANWADTAGEIASGETLKALSFVTSHYNLLRECLRRKKKEASIRELDFSTITPDDEEDISIQEEID
jgi:DNA-binding FadR family transcriptional regulator